MVKRIKNYIVSPISKFVKIESFGGILLFCAAVVAMIWANSPYAMYYEQLWNQKVGFKIGGFELYKSLILWINDGLMAVFFFLIGLEIKREVLLGELNTLKKAALPIFAAIGGIIFPVAIFFILNDNPETEGGWGIPMATDIAFSLAILQILGSRVPLSLKIFLTAFAIVDDLVAVLVIAVFYSENIEWMLILYAAIPLLILSFFSRKGFYNKYVFFSIGTVIWFLFLKSGVHPTLAGVIMAFMVPIYQKQDVGSSISNLQNIVLDLVATKGTNEGILSKDQIYKIDDLQDWTTKVQSPLQKLEHELHGVVAYIVIPIFALANAGIPLNSDVELDKDLAFNLIMGLIVGKFLGVFIMSFIGVKSKIAVLPQDVNFKHITGVGLLAGVGFTMAIFISNLAFTDNELLIDSSKLGILVGSLIAGFLGYFVLRFFGK